MADAAKTDSISTRKLAGDVVISAIGMCSPVGASALQTFTSVRAGITRIAEQPEIYHCLPEDPLTGDPEPIVASAISHLDVTSRRESRPLDWLALLAAQAFRDLRRNACLTPAEEAQMGLSFSLPAARPGFGPESEAAFSVQFHNHAEKDLSQAQSVFLGHTGALALCEHACAAIQERRVACVAVGGVDSYLFPQWLEPLDRQYRIKSDRNLDGFVPGEGAAFLLLESATQASRRNRTPWARLRGFSAGSVQTVGDCPNTGTALAEMLRQLLQGEAQQPIFVGDLNGETYRMREWSYAVARLGDRLQAPVSLEIPATSLGDIGAASGASLAALTVQLLRKKYARASSAVVFSGSDTGDRRALLLGRTATV